MKELAGETGVLVGLDLPSAGGGTEAGVWSPHRGNCRVSEKTFKDESETADLWQPKWNENQTVLAAAIHTPNDTVAGSWSLGIVEQSQGEGCWWLWRDGLGMWGSRSWWEVPGRRAGQTWKQGDTAESRVGGGAISIASPTTRQHRQLNSREAGLSSAWCTELQSRTPPRLIL